jgi:phosphomannomutase
MAELIISISGMRGIVGENLTAAIAAEYGCAFGSYLMGKVGRSAKLSVAIGQDSRPSGNMLKAAVSAGLCAAGVNVVDLGIVTTPCVGIMLRHLKCAGGVVITASHNPLPYNGIKLLLDNGIAPPPPVAEAIKNSYLQKSFTLVDSPGCGKITCNDQTDDIHIEKVLATVDARLIAGKRFKVALDSVNGAGARITKKLLEQLGCEIIAINDEPHGIFAHTPEPTVENVKELCDVVRQKGAAVGFAQDPDADRLAIVDEKGRYIGEEYTLALAAKHVLSKEKGCAAANLSTSRMVDDVAAAVGATVLRTPVGEAHVAGAMVENKCIIGGEGNGGIIDLRVGPVRDSLVGIALVLEMMAQTGKSVSPLVGEIPAYVMIKDKVTADKALAQKVLAAAREQFTGARLDTRDGYRFDFDDGGLHLRTSNTEPVMRIIAEARNEAAAKNYVAKVKEILKAIQG